MFDFGFEIILLKKTSDTFQNKFIRAIWHLRGAVGGGGGGGGAKLTIDLESLQRHL